MKVKKLIRVTSVLDFVESKWKEYWWRKVGFEAADKISKESAEFGTKVHALIGEMLVNMVSSESTNVGPISFCAERVIKYLKDNKIIPFTEKWKDSLEVEVKDKKLGLVGHFDFLALVDGQLCIIDFKTSNKMRKSFPLQKAAYAYMANKQMGVKIDRGLTLRSHWNKDTQEVEFEFKEYDNLIKKYWPKFKACLAVYKYFN